MKLAVQERLLPGRSLAQRLDLAEQLGFEGIELSGFEDLLSRDAEIEQALANRRIKFCTICGQRPFDFLSPEPSRRAESMSICKELLALAGKFGAVGQINPISFRPPKLPDLQPYKSSLELEYELFCQLAQELAETAEKNNTLLLLEPLNRYETYFMNRQEQAVELIQRINRPGVALISDFFHMHIEETNTAETLRRVGPYVRHVHLADNTRKEPGTGDIDFRAGFAALKQAGFADYMALECSLSDPHDPAGCLERSVQYLRSCMGD